MSKFNTSVKSPELKSNLAGGQAYKQSLELELISILTTSFVSDQFYRSSDQTLIRIKEILNVIDPLFAAKAA